jgi:hypothetical protein
MKCHTFLRTETYPALIMNSRHVTVNESQRICSELNQLKLTSGRANKYADVYGICRDLPALSESYLVEIRGKVIPLLNRAFRHE